MEYNGYASKVSFSPYGERERERERERVVQRNIPKKIKAQKNKEDVIKRLRKIKV